MSQLVVNISDMKFSKRTEDVLATYSLGSCLGVTAYDPVACVGGLLHALLPTASVAPEKAKANPYMFVTSGVANMVKTLFRLGATRDNLVFRVAGGADMRGDTLFRTGARNVEALTRLLNKNKIKIAGKETGGSIPRTLFLYMDTGRVVVRSFGKETEI